MALFKRIKEPVTGSAVVLGVDGPPMKGRTINTRFHLRVTAPGLSEQEVSVRSSMPGRKWPDVGQTLPVRFDRDDPSRLEILWDDVPEVTDVAWAVACAIADGVNAGEADGLPAYPEAAKELIRQYPGMAPVGLEAAPFDLGLTGPAVTAGVPAAATAPAPTPTIPGFADHRLAAIETLAELRDRGALTDAEFQAQKQALLRIP